MCQFVRYRRAFYIAGHPGKVMQMLHLLDIARVSNTYIRVVEFDVDMFRIIDIVDYLAYLHNIAITHVTCRINSFAGRPKWI